MKLDKSLKSKEKLSKNSNFHSSRKEDSHIPSTSNRKLIICPWVTREYDPGMVGLHEEIEEFYNYMRPTSEEKAMRDYVVNRVKDVVAQLWPLAKVELFGSFPTDLYLPTSDIDIVLFGEWKHLPLHTLEEELIRQGLAEKSTTRVIEHSAVPIVKFQHVTTDINVDISFNKMNGIEGVQVIKNFIKKFPVLPKLMYVLKHFLYMRELNEVFTGGLGSYALFMLCVSFLQLHPRSDARFEGVNLGVLLIEFFELYGRCFNYGGTCIRIKDGGSYLNKQQFHRGLNIQSSSMLSIEDPVTIGNDLCKGSYAMPQVQLAFDFAYRAFTTAMCKEDYRTKKRFASSSYLRYIMNINPVATNKRNMLCQKWRESRDQLTSMHHNDTVDVCMKRGNELDGDDESSFEPKLKKSKREINSNDAEEDRDINVINYSSQHKLT